MCVSLSLSLYIYIYIDRYSSTFAEWSGHLRPMQKVVGSNLVADIKHRGEVRLTVGSQR